MRDLGTADGLARAGAAGPQRGPKGPSGTPVLSPGSRNPGGVKRTLGKVEKTNPALQGPPYLGVHPGAHAGRVNWVGSNPGSAHPYGVSRPWATFLGPAGTLWPALRPPDRGHRTTTMMLSRRPRHFVTSAPLLHSVAVQPRSYAVPFILSHEISPAVHPLGLDRENLKVSACEGEPRSLDEVVWMPISVAIREIRGKGQRRPIG